MWTIPMGWQSVSADGTMPSANDVRYGTAVAFTTGLCHVPDKSRVRRGTSVDTSDEGQLPITEPE